MFLFCTTILNEVFVVTNSDLSQRHELKECRGRGQSLSHVFNPSFQRFRSFSYRWARLTERLDAVMRKRHRLQMIRNLSLGSSTEIIRSLQ